MAKPHVLVIPYPAQGHVIPILELAQCLVTKGVKVTFINTEVNHSLVTSNCSDKDGFGDLMQMVSLPDGIESSEDRSDIRKLNLSMLQTMPRKLEELIEKINKEDSSKVSCVIADDSMAWAIQVAKKMGISSAAFWPASVATLASILSFQKLIDDGIINKKGIPLSSEMIRLSETMPPIKPQNLAWACLEDTATIEVFFQVAIQAEEASRLTEWFICNSCPELEAAAFSLYSQLLPIGPLLAKNRLADQAGHFWQEDSTCLAWLDQQPPCSVIYVAFGSFAIFNQTQFEELALGLELSNRPFLWVVRPGMTKETTTDYPDGYMERIGSRGRIVSWAPQQKVLSHPSVACFISHCGWNSILEGVTNGVPFLCLPYFGDQFHNETYICDIWKTGMGLEKDEAGIITRGEIKSKVEKLLSDKTFRVKALYIKQKVISSVSKGGCSHKNLNNFIEWIQQNDTNAKDQPDSIET
ncbi:putative 7-deoxyloganetin glucosyltransferase [Helianthus annuus]|nr:putative 7-deoxyloganetin glucosyltransferase [Helianthus annuus]KAJ0447080.1 putative 7-deoxyloganetin glucosyltransferase [Helianthus annuus]KAJ0631985.1 putative 7-deoxyloganetin glucosyltransferase [Helianthus annuus]KAJ0635870.1 putative 7-deoxyloganetin glucosyltransferase [Helianthus annuus]KAJ0812687.1 putative 7-deoxyloganetin glucosyltransferase [Helianthus annuus]